MEKMVSFIPMPQTHIHDDIIESIVMKERIKVLEDKVDLLVRELTKLERFIRDHEDYYDHRSLNE